MVRAPTRTMSVNLFGLSQKHIDDTLGRCLLSSDCLITTGGMEMSATYPALFGPHVPQLPVDRFGNGYATVSGTGPD